MESPFEKIVSRLGERVKVRRHNSRHASAQCTAHSGKGLNLHVKEYPNGDAWPKCFSMGCSTKAIMESIGLEMRDGYAKPSNGHSTDWGAISLKGRKTATQILETYNNPVIGRRLSDIEEEPITWLWEPFIPLGMYTLIDGEEGIGKTWITLAIASAISTGTGLYGVSEYAHIGPGNVLLISPEDSASMVIKPRLRLMEANMDRVIVVEDPIALNTVGGVLDFKRALQEHNPMLVVFDPIFACVGGIDLNQDNQVRGVTSQLKSLAEEFNTAIVGIRHIGKSKGMGNARNAGLGGVAWRASARSNPLIGKNPENDRERAIVQTKSNLLPDGTTNSIGYVITSEYGLQWTGHSMLTAEQMLSFKPQETHQERSEREEAREFLKEFLRDGPKPQQEIMKAAKAALGISDSTVRRAKADLNIKPGKRGMSGPWEWSL